MEFACLVHADWSVNARKRWQATAIRRTTGWWVEAVLPVGDTTEFVAGLIAKAARSPTLAGLDFPIGVPAAYGRATGLAGMGALIQAMGNDEWSDFEAVACSHHEIGLRRPFYPAASRKGVRQSDLISAHGVVSFDDLRRQCERATPTRRAACPLFWTLGGNQVGKGALSGWREVVRPALEAGAHLWPFDGSLSQLAKLGGLTLAETYPAEAYGHVRATFQNRESKRRQSDRKAKSDAILEWADRTSVGLADQLKLQIRDGFGESSHGEDQFDALLGLLGMIEVACGRRAEGGAADTEWEGWILGQTSL